MMAKPPGGKVNKSLRLHGPAKGFVNKPAQGAGWGGPARGAHERPDTAPRFAEGNRMGTLPPNARAAERRQRAAEMEDTIYDLAAQAEREETRLAAARALHAIYEGTPVARTVTYNTNELSDLDDGALESKRQELEAKLRRDTGGAEPPTVGKPH